MGSISFMCPMCCGETFTNSESLKYHLLSMTDNLFCPGCSLRTYSVAALIQHLDCCGKEMEEVHNQKETVYNKETQSLQEETVDDMLMNDTEDGMDDHFLATVNEDGTMILCEGRTIQVDENGDIKVVDKISACNDKQILKMDKVNYNSKIIELENKSNEVSESTKADDANLDSIPVVTTEGFLSETDLSSIVSSHYVGIKQEQDVINKEQVELESDVSYNCSTCNISFSSVLEHINKYHDGQEVVLEMSDDPLEELQKEQEDNVSLTVAMNASTKPFKTIIPKSTKQIKPKQSMNTLRIEECTDNDGRIYTRKVVQIERFWDKTPVTLPNSKAPMIEKFFSNVQGVKVRDKSVTVAPTHMFRCNQCLEQFPKLNDYRRHMCPQGTNRCSQCDQTFATVSALKTHAKTHGENFPSQKIFLCTVCGTEFLTHKSLRLHSRMHQPVRTRHVDAPEGAEEECFDCEECGATLSESYRQAHMALHAGDTITCSVCNRKFDSTESLAMHAAVHTDISNPLGTELYAKCQESETQLNQEQLVESVLEPANNEGSTITESTQNEFKNSNPTNQASEQVELQSLKPYQCQHCGRRFTRPHEKVKHERIHTGEKPHSCEVCGKKFRVSYCLTLHMRTHTGVRPYECQHCGKRFKASSVYNHHLLTHGDERAYTCPYCPKTFKTRVQLAGHKNSHTKPFRCTECSRPFASLYAARAHIQTHKKDNNLKFSCTVCGASYGRAFALKDHMRQHHDLGIMIPPEAIREEEVQEVEHFFIPDVCSAINPDELIVPSPPLSSCGPTKTGLGMDIITINDNEDRS